jgi:hypothetical protein
LRASPRSRASPPVQMAKPASSQRLLAAEAARLEPSPKMGFCRAAGAGRHRLPRGAVWISKWAARIAARPPVGPTISPWVPAWVHARPSRDAYLLLPSLLRVVPPRLRGGQLVRWVPYRLLRRASTPGELPPLRQVGATRPVVFRPRGSIPTSTAYSAHRFPGCCTWYRYDFAGFHLALPPTRPGCPRLLGEGHAGLSRSVAFTPLEEPASRTLAHPGYEPRTSRTASPRPLPPCRFHDFEAFLWFERPPRNHTVAGALSANCPSMGFVPLRGLRLARARVCAPTSQPVPVRGSSRRLRGVCPVEALPRVTVRRPPWGF